jgi:hypothetical protein
MTKTNQRHVLFSAPIIVLILFSLDNQICLRSESCLQYVGISPEASYPLRFRTGQLTKQGGHVHVTLTTELIYPRDVSELSILLGDQL